MHLPSLRLPGLPSLGALSLAALATCALSGAVVMTGFDPTHPLASTLSFETAHAWGWFFRALHAWSAELLLLVTLAHGVESVARRHDRTTSLPGWLAMVATLPVLIYLMLGGAALRGDAEGQGVAAVMHGLARVVPWAGRSLADLLVGRGAQGDVRTLLAHHAATATLVLVVLASRHLERLVPAAPATGLALGLAGLMAVARRPALGPLEAAGRLRGPWYLGGLRVVLGWTPAWLAGVLLPVAVLALLGALPAMSDKAATRARRVLLAVSIGYLGLVLGSVVR